MIGAQTAGSPGPFFAQAAVWTSLGQRFFVRLEARFSVPARTCEKAPRAEAVKAAPLARPAGLGLDGFEHGARLEAAGAEIISAPPASKASRRCAEDCSGTPSASHVKGGGKPASLHAPVTLAGAGSLGAKLPGMSR
jgi:hypothetical protein